MVECAQSGDRGKQADLQENQPPEISRDQRVDGADVDHRSGGPRQGYRAEPQAGQYREPPCKLALRRRRGPAKFGEERNQPAQP